MVRLQARALRHPGTGAAETYRLRGEQYVACSEAQSHAAERPHDDNDVAALIGLGYSSGVVSLDVVYHYDDCLASRNLEHARA